MNAAWLAGLAAGFALGWFHFTVFCRGVGALVKGPPGGRLQAGWVAFTAGRRLLTAAAGLCVVGPGGLPAEAVGVGLVSAALAWRVRGLRLLPGGEGGV